MSTSESSKVCLDAVVAGHLGEDDEGMKRLEEAIEDHSKDNAFLYDAACAYSVASQVAADKQAAKSKIYAERAVALLKQAVTNGYSDYSHMQTDPDLDPLHEHAAFQELLAKGQLDRRYAAVWQENAQYEAVESHGLSPEDHLKKCQEFSSQGYRPVALSAATIGEQGTLVTGSVWHRPVILEDDKEKLAKRQCNAAIGLLCLGEVSSLWPLLKHSPDPRVRTWIVHRLGPMGASAEALVARLEEEADVSVRRALILALGEYDDISPVDQEALGKKLLALYKNDPDPGIHGASEWLLRRWGKKDGIATIDADLAASNVEGNRRWYINGQGQTMAVIPGPVEFLMGSPATEKGHRPHERLHRQYIGHSFSIASEEVTVEQFHRFLRATPSIRHNYEQRYAPEPDCPQTAVAWYEAAAYCRWLSEQEHIAEDQMCYPMISEIKEGMRLPKDYLSRTGYRLPSEAEWAYACRAATSTSRYYGEAEGLLAEYAWYQHTANDRSWPVAALKPNDFGLFDMQGNVSEWCQEQYRSYPASTKNRPVEDREDTTPVTDEQVRVLRSSSFNLHPSATRSAGRGWGRPTTRLLNGGFRPARSLPLSFFAPLPPDAGNHPERKD